MSFDLGESQRELEEVFKRMFAREDPVGWITGYEDETQALAVQEYLDSEDAG